MSFRRNVISWAVVVGILLVGILTTNVSAQEIELVSLRGENPPEATKYNYILDQLSSLGADALLDNVKVEIYPADIVAYKQGDKIGMANRLTVCQANQHTGVIEARIILAKGSDIDTLLHELGHVVEMKLGVVNGSWADANNMGKAYVKMKKYTEKMDQVSQNRLPWYERLSEWFAEDVRQFLSQKLSPGYYYKGVGPEKTKEVDDFLEKLIFLPVVTL